MIFVGIDWATVHHDVCVMDELGEVIDRLRIANSLEGVRRVHSAVASLVEHPQDIVIGIETSLGLMPRAMVSAGYSVYAINPLVSNRYRDRHTISRAKSDRADAEMLANLVRTDRQNHRLFVPDSSLAENIKLLARAHQTLIWNRQRQANQLREALSVFYPAALVAFGNDVASRDAVAVLARASTPAAGRRLTLAQLRSTLVRAGRQRNVDKRALAIQGAFRAEYLQVPTEVALAYGAIVRANATVIAQLTEELSKIEAQLATSFYQHEDSAILESLPGLGTVLAARVLGEFGDDKGRFSDARARRNYAGTSPITRASGTKRVVVARFTRNDRLVDACDRWAFSSLNGSPGARRYYDAKRKMGRTNGQALRALANRWVGILHGCLRHRQQYSEAVAWPAALDIAA